MKYIIINYLFDLFIKILNDAVKRTDNTLDDAYLRLTVDNRKLIIAMIEERL